MNSKPTLILLHGALGSKAQFLNLNGRLKDSFKIFTLNFEGHGGRTGERDFSIQNFSKNLQELIETENLGPANIFGYSMGGYVALKLAIDHPGKVNRIMTLGTKFEWTPETANREVSRLNPLVIEEKLPKFAHQLKERHSPQDWHQVLSKTGEMMLSLGKGAALNTEDFEKIECLVLITVGSDDQMVSNKESRDVANAIPNSSCEVFEGFKHPIEQVDIEILAKKIETFFLG